MSERLSAIGAAGNRLAGELSGAGPACLAVHGLGDGSYVWRDLAGLVGDRRRLIRPDLRGHGDSDWVADAAYGVADHRADLLTLLEDLEVGSVVVIGHSLGARLAIELALARPDRVRGLCLLDYAPRANPAALERLHGDLAAGFAGAYPTIATYEAALLARRPMLTAETARWIAENALRLLPTGDYRLKTDPRVVASRGPGAPSDAIETRLAAIRCPTLVVRGARSAMVSPLAMEATTAAIPGARSAVTPRAGHALLTENGAAVAALCEDFIAETLSRLPA
ncbi:MAG: alpha/beta hydrolase [Phenylobacterium sp.]|jgi:2-(acetamidomethylene)succinate hydrolase|uniref:alpha/beta fold hydrolase n=1 Tax=Phenylobacterium sp. TaxID=1871053 RepID=UPI0025CC1DF0|nr:alpha/beta hydrolase [Phenylobacterium sp.]MCA3708469.1 alpha/beta hydrolase [Phenylobacterium sp.]